jgi:hypothetical protein
MAGVTLNRFPTYTEPLSTKGETTRGWYTFWSGLAKGQPFAPIQSVIAGTSPYTYVAGQGGHLIVQGGTVSLVSLTRDGINNVNTGQTQGLFPMSQGDSLIITYSSIPNLTFVPR